MKKYELVTNDTINLADGTILYRIKALKSFNDIGKGDLGGYVATEDNLSHEGYCWIYQSGKVYGEAIVSDNAVVCGEAEVFDFATVKDSAIVTDHAHVYGHATIAGNAFLEDRAMAYNHVTIRDTATLSSDAQVYVDNTVVCGNAMLNHNAEVKSSTDYLVVGPMSSKADDFITYYNTDYGIYAHSIDFDACSIEDFEDEIKTHKDMGIEPEEYCDKILASISFAKSMLY